MTVIKRSIIYIKAKVIRLTQKDFWEHHRIIAIGFILTLLSFPYSDYFSLIFFSNSQNNKQVEEIVSESTKNININTNNASSKLLSQVEKLNNQLHETILSGSNDSDEKRQATLQQDTSFLKTKSTSSSLAIQPTLIWGITIPAVQSDDSEKRVNLDIRAPDVKTEARFRYYLAEAAHGIVARYPLSDFHSTHTLDINVILSEGYFTSSCVGKLLNTTFTLRDLQGKNGNSSETKTMECFNQVSNEDIAQNSAVKEAVIELKNHLHL